MPLKSSESQILSTKTWFTKVSIIVTKLIYFMYLCQLVEEINYDAVNETIASAYRRTYLVITNNK